MTDHPKLPNNPDLRGALDALFRAGNDARELAARTGTRFVVVEAGELRYIDPESMGTAHAQTKYEQDI
jgi:hypothetical protein